MKLWSRTCAILLLLLPTALPAEQLTTVAVINVEKIFNSFYKDSQEIRALEDARKEFQSEIDSYVQQLKALQLENMQSAEEPDNDSSDNREQKIQRLKDFIANLSKQRQLQLEEQRQSLMSNNFVQALQRSTRFICESEGYSVVLQSDTPGLLWWASIVDISDKVLAHLVKSRKQS